MVFFKKNKNFFQILIILLIFFSYFKMTIFGDEAFTLNLIHHNLLEIVQIDSLDVHPPLYYLVLKVVTSVLLFFPHSLFLEIMVGRVFSILCTIIMFVYLRKITSIIGIKVNKYTQFILFLFLPNVLNVYSVSSLQPVVDIRMYAMAGLLVSASLYYLLLFDRENKNKFLFISIIFGELAAYTHYFAALGVGLIYIMYFLIYIYYRNLNKSAMMITAGIIYGLLYVPWILYAVLKETHQITAGFWISYKLLALNAFEILFIIFIFLMFFINLWKSKKNNILLVVLSTNILIVIIATLVSLMSSPILLLRYMYPTLIIYEFISISYVLQNFSIKHINKYFIYILSTISIMSLFICVYKEIPKSIDMVKYGINQSNNHHKYVVIYDDDDSIYNEKAMYLVSINKRFSYRIKNETRNKLYADKQKLWSEVHSYMYTYIEK